MAKQYNPWTGFLEDNTTKANVNDAAPVVGKKYTINGKEFKVLEVKGDNVKVLGSNGIVNHLNIRMFDEKPTIDKAIRSCDVNKAEGFKIYNAHVRNDTLYIEYEDLMYGNGKKEKESFTRSQAKKLLTDPWNTWLGTSKMVVKQFVG